MRRNIAAFISAPILAAGLLGGLGATSAHAATTFTGQATFYDAGVTLDAVGDDLGLTTCAGLDPDNAVQALSAPEATINAGQLNGNSNCGKFITVTDTATGKSTKVRVVDECAGCNVGNLDLSPSASEAIGATGTSGGVTWSWD